jgi:hypothetical protein
MASIISEKFKADPDAMKMVKVIGEINPGRVLHINLS